MAYSARIEADSISEYGDRLTTFVVTYPEIIHNEMLTHRVFSRNASSSRAIPTEKLIKQVERDPFIPTYWGKNQSGMAAKEELSRVEQMKAKAAWLVARNCAVTHARRLASIGAHKQTVNRLLLPWKWITVVITATEWDNFFKLRCAPDAQPEMHQIANMMRDAYVHPIDPPRKITDGWHLPFIMESEEGDIATALSLSVARCARVSYLTHDAKHDPEKDLLLAKRLQESGHWSPFEHQATPTLRDCAGNFTGWRQYRHYREGAPNA
jgi:thymidylate synthase ThyX